VRLTHEEALISALAIGVALGVTKYESDGVALGTLLVVVGFLASFAIFELLKRR
jgi:hypothetical protein